MRLMEQCSCLGKIEIEVPDDVMQSERAENRTEVDRLHDEWKQVHVGPECVRNRPSAAEQESAAAEEATPGRTIPG